MPPIPPRRPPWRTRLHQAPPSAWLIAAAGLLIAASHSVAEEPPPGLAAEESARVRALLDTTDRHYRQIEPSLARLLANHGGQFAGLDATERATRLARLATFIDRIRDGRANDVVIGPRRRVIGLLDPDPRLDPREITALSEAYGADAVVLKAAGDDTIATVADRFLDAVEAAAAGQQPTTIVVLGHGLPEEIQSYAIPVDRLARNLIAGTARWVNESNTADLGHLVVICDDCFSADFLTNLGHAIERHATAGGGSIVALPTCIAGTSYGRVGRADVATKFVPHFWKDVIELYYIRRPWPDAVTLADFFEKVDNMMYGYGRTPLVEEGRVVGYRTVDADAIQDPVVFVSLTAAELAELRSLLGLPADAPLPRLLDIG